MARTFIALIAFVSFLAVPASVQAASVTVKETGSRTIAISYTEMPKGATFSVTDPKGAVIKEARVPKVRGIKRIQLPKDALAGAYAVVARDDGTEIARTSFSIAYEAPTCKMTLSEKRAMRGDNVTLRWSSDNADRATVFGSMKAKAHGAERIALYQPGVRVFNGAFYGKGGVALCSAKVTVGE